MVLTVKQATKHVDHTLYEAKSDIDAIEVINTAGRLMYQMREWNFRQRGPSTLSETASQSFIDLPSDFGELVRIDTVEGLTTGLDIVSLPEIQELRTESIGNPRYLWGAIAWEVPSGGSQIQPRLEIYPTPGSNNADSITIFYRARWVLVSDDDAQLQNIPEFAEPLYLRVCRQVARSYEDEDVVPYTDALNSLQGCLEYRMAVKSDANVQRSYGPLRHGVGESEAYAQYWYWDRTVQGPA